MIISFVNVRAVTSTSSMRKSRYNESSSASLIAKTEVAQSARISIKNVRLIMGLSYSWRTFHRAKRKRSDLGPSTITVAGQSGIFTRVLFRYTLFLSQ